MGFNMKGVKLVNLPFSFYINLYSSLCHVYKKEKVISPILYSSTVGGLMNAMKWSTILHVVGVASEHMTSPGEVVKWVVKYFKGISVTFSGCSDLVCGSYFVVGMEKRRYTPSYVSKYCFGRKVMDGGGVFLEKVHIQ